MAFVPLRLEHNELNAAIAQVHRAPSYASSLFARREPPAWRARPIRCRDDGARRLGGIAAAHLRSGQGSGRPKGAQQDHSRDQGYCPPIRPWGAQGAGQDRHTGESEAARVAACREILDRAYGKAIQPIQATVEYGISEQLSELFKENAGNIPAAIILPTRAPICAPCRTTSVTEIPSIPPITPVLPGTGLRGRGSRSSHTLSRLAG